MASGTGAVCQANGHDGRNTRLQRIVGGMRNVGIVFSDDVRSGDRL